MSLGLRRGEELSDAGGEAVDVLAPFLTLLALGGEGAEERGAAVPLGVPAGAREFAWGHVRDGHEYDGAGRLHRQVGVYRVGRGFDHGEVKRKPLSAGDLADHDLVLAVAAVVDWADLHDASQVRRGMTAARWPAGKGSGSV